MSLERLLLGVANPARYNAVRVAFGDAFDVTCVDNRWEADAVVDTDPDIIIVEDVLPGGRGVKICERARERRGCKNALILIIADHESSAVEEAKDAGIIDGWMLRNSPAGTILHGFWELYSARDDQRLSDAEPEAKAILDQSRQLFRNVSDGLINSSTRTMLSQTATRVVTFADQCSVSSVLGLLQGHHAYTFAHSLRVGILMATFGRHLGLSTDSVTLMAETGLAHDVGKLRIPIEILAKPARLNDTEMAVMRTHPELGATMLAEVYADQPALISAVRHHHEQLGGTGYPHGLRGGQIDELSLLTAVVDVYTALTDHRDYKPAMPIHQATAIMDQMAGRHLEPKLYRRFCEVALDLAASDSAESAMTYPRAKAQAG